MSLQRYLQLLWIVLAATVASEAGARAIPTPPDAKQITFVDVHPIPAEAGGGFCNIEGPRVHIYWPDHAGELSSSSLSGVRSRNDRMRGSPARRR